MGGWGKKNFKRFLKNSFYQFEKQYFHFVFFAQMESIWFWILIKKSIQRVEETDQWWVTKIGE